MNERTNERLPRTASRCLLRLALDDSGSVLACVLHDCDCVAMWRLYVAVFVDSSAPVFTVSVSYAKCDMQFLWRRRAAVRRF